MNFPMFGKVAESSPCTTFLFVFLTVVQKVGRIENFVPLKPKVPGSLWWELSTMVCWGASLRAVIRAVTTGGRGAQFTGRRITMRRWVTVGPPKSLNNVTSTFFNAVHWGAKLASFPGRHLTSLRPWPRGKSRTALSESDCVCYYIT